MRVYGAIKQTLTGSHTQKRWRREKGVRWWGCGLQARGGGALEWAVGVVRLEAGEHRHKAIALTAAVACFQSQMKQPK